MSRTSETRFAVLAISSLYFYSVEVPIYVVLLLASVAINYLMAIYIDKVRSRQRLTLAVAFNLGLLGVFKYYNFFVDQFDGIFGIDLNLNIVLPIGISFYTFQQIAYQVDVYRGDRAYRNLIRYATFVTFFPQLIAGPIVHHREMMPQFEYVKRFRSSDFCVGLILLAIGLIKKVVIADTMATFATPVFTAAELGPVSMTASWVGSSAYTMQLYFDFSGYSDMALGLARLFGIRLPLNFNMPYRATSVIEFWRRWHITLSRFLRDYLYIPLGGSRAGSGRRWFYLMVTMLLGGLWHGAAWTFVAWGGLHGLFLIINHGWNKWQLVQMRTSLPAWRHLFGWLMTFMAVAHSWVFFRATSFAGALNIVQGMWGLQSSPASPIADVVAAPLINFTMLWRDFTPLWRGPLTQSYDSYAATYFLPLFLIALFLATRRTNELVLSRRLGLALRSCSRWANVGFALGFVAIFYFVSVLTSYGSSEFLYFQF